MEKRTAEQSQAATLLSCPCSNASSTHTGYGTETPHSWAWRHQGRWETIVLSFPSLPCLHAGLGHKGRAQQVEVPMSTSCHAADGRYIQEHVWIQYRWPLWQSSNQTAQSWCNRTFSTDPQNPSWANTQSNCSLKKKNWFGKGVFNWLPQHCAAPAALPGMLSQPEAGRETQDSGPPTGSHKVGPPLWNTADLRAIVTACRLYKQERK